MSVAAWFIRLFKPDFQPAATFESFTAISPDAPPVDPARLDAWITNLDRTAVRSNRRPGPWDDDPRRSRPLVESAQVEMAIRYEPCLKCGRRPAAVKIADGVLVDEDAYICAPCLLDAVDAYPEHGD